MGQDETFRQVNRYSAVHGFAAGFPNYQQADYGQGLVSGTVLLRTGVVQWQNVLRTTYGNANIDDVPALFRAANDYAASNGFAAGFPTCEQGLSNGTVVYGTNLIPAGSTEFRDVLQATLGVPDRRDVPAMMRAADVFAVANGFAAGFPTFHQADYGQGVVYGLVLFKYGTATRRDVPTSFLAKYTKATRWAVVMCFASDTSGESATVTNKVTQFFRTEGRGSGGALDYWFDVSYGTIDLDSSEVFGWFDLGATTDQIDALTSHAQRSAVHEWGRATAGANHVDLASYDHLLVLLNRPCDSGSVGKDVVIGIVPPVADKPLFTSPNFVGHEMGHGLGLIHGFGESPTPCATPGGPGEYCDTLTIMSYANVAQFVQFPRAHPTWDDVLNGPGLNAPELDQLGALPYTRIWTAPATPFSATVTLAALNRPDVDAPLMARFNALSRTGAGTSTYALEYREPTEWDRGFGSPLVLIHELRAGQKYVLLTDFSGGAFPGPGAIFLSPDQKTAVRLESTDRATSTATVRIWTVLGQGERGVTIRRVIANPAGGDPLRERVILENTAITSVDLTDWILTDAKDHEYDFPPITIPEGFVFSVWTGKGNDTFANLFWQRAAPVWNNDGDTATLRNGSGLVISRLTYP